MKELERPNVFAITNFRHIRKKVGIKPRDRLSHMYIIGKTGTGKTTMLQTMILQDVTAGNGICVLDPHGDLLEGVMKLIPQWRKDDVIYIDASDMTQPWGYNPLKRVRADKRPLAASGFLEVMKMLWHGREWGVRMEHILRNALLALMDQPKATLPDVLRLLTDKQYQKEVVGHIENRQVKKFWTEEYPKYAARMRSDAIVPVQNKIGAFLANPSMYKIIAEPEKVIHFREIMDEGKVLLINLAKGKIGSDAANLLGGLIVTTVGLAAYSRAEVDEDKRRNFYFYVDEFQNYSTLSFANMLSELRKYKIGMVLANQYLFQLDADVRNAVLGNAGTLVCFRVGPHDAHLLASEFQKKKIEAYDLLIAPNYFIYLKLMIDGTPTEGFTATTIQYKP
jgi:Type IV secretion-system coupling protein DNA-binding domain